MTKLEAFTGVVSGDFMSMHKDKVKYLLLDGSMVTPRKKAMPMDNLMEEGWEVEVAPKWQDHIDTGMFCIAYTDEGDESFPIVITSMEEGIATDVNGAVYSNVRPATMDDLVEYIWDPDAESNAPVKKPKIKTATQAEKAAIEEKADAPAEEVVEKEPVEVVDTTPVEDNTVSIEADAARIDDSMIEEDEIPFSQATGSVADVEKSQPLSKSPTVKNQEDTTTQGSQTANEKSSKTNVSESEKKQPSSLDVGEQRQHDAINAKPAQVVGYRTRFKDLGLPDRQFHKFWKHTNSDGFDMDGLFEKGDDYVRTYIKEFVDANS